MSLAEDAVARDYRNRYRQDEASPEPGRAGRR